MRRTFLSTLFTCITWMQQTQLFGKGLSIRTSQLTPVRLSLPFTHIGIDHSMEHLNKSTKGQGGISRVTSYPTTFLKFCFTAPELARFSAEAESLVTVTNSTTTTTQYHCLSQANITHQERVIIQLMTVLASFNLFQSPNTQTDRENTTSVGQMFKHMSKEIISQNNVQWRK